MLHILLGLLKIIGIILAVIIGLVLLVVFIVLVAALRYEVTTSADGDLKSLRAKVKFSWLSHLIFGYVTYQEEKVDWQVKILWKKLNVPKKEKTVKKAPAEKPVEEKPAVEKPAVEKPAVEKSIIENTAVDKPAVEEHSQKQTSAEKKTKRKTKKKIKKKVKDKKPLSEKIQSTIQKVSDKIKQITEIKDKIVAFIEAEAHKKAFLKLLKELLRLLKKLKPKKLKANVEFGFEDPSKTGSILAYLSMLYPFYGDNINITPHFEDAVLKGDVYLKGRIRIVYVVSMGIRLILDKNIRFTIKDVRKLVAKK